MKVAHDCPLSSGGKSRRARRRYFLTVSLLALYPTSAVLLDPFGPPSPIIDRHLLDQTDGFRRYSRSSGSYPRLPSPIQLETLPVPSGQRIRLHHYQCFPPSL